MAADSYEARTEARAGTQAAPPLLNTNVGNALQPATKVGTQGDTGQVATPTGGTDRPNS